jgi:hypothetical protein
MWPRSTPPKSPHAIAWAGLDGDEIVIASLRYVRKLRNIERDSRVSLCIEGLGIPR